MKKFNLNYSLLVTLFLSAFLIVAFSDSPKAFGLSIGAPSQTGTTTSSTTTSSSTSASAPTSPSGNMYITANSKKGSITVPYGTDVGLNWGFTNTLVNGPCTATWSTTSQNPYGQLAIKALTATTVYSITCGADSAAVTVNVRPQGSAPFTVDLKINNQDSPVTVDWAAPITVSWTANYPDAAINCALSHTSPYPDNNAIAVYLPGQETVNLPAAGSYAYTLVCDGFGSEHSTDSATVTVQPETQPIKVDLKINNSDSQVVLNYNGDPQQVQDINLSWTSNYPDLTCSANGGSGFDNWPGAKAASGQFTGKVKAGIINGSNVWVYRPYDWTYTINCSGRGETTTDSVTVSFPPAAPLVYSMDFKANGQDGPLTVDPGTNVLLSWTTQNYDPNVVRCTAMGDWSGIKHLPSGQESTGALYSNKVYTLSCQALDPYERNIIKDSQKSIVVTVSAGTPTPTPTPNPNPTPTPTPTPIPTPTLVIPPAGFEDKVLTNFDQYQNPFSDTNTSDLCGQAAAELYRRAVVGGFSDGTFKNGDPVNRAQAAKFLLLASGHPITPSAKNNFKDVRTDQWYSKFVLQAAQLGIIKGYSDRTFRPEKTVNEAEFLKMLTLTFGLETNLPYSYTDVKSTDWFAAYAGIAQKYDLFPQEVQTCSGSSYVNSTTRLNPGKTLTRADVAVAIYQYLKNK